MAHLPRICWNPVAFQTAKEALGHSEYSLPRRALGAMSGAIHDVLFRNPYEMTIGNAKRIFFTDSPRYSVTKKIAGCAAILFGSMYSLLLLGTESLLCAKGIVSLGLGVGSTRLVQLGRAAQQIGEKILLSGAVPLYGALYALPKKVIECAPAALRALAKPVVSAARSVIRVITPAVSYLYTKISLVARWTFDHLLSPLWHSVLRPAAVVIARCISKVVRPIASHVAKAVSWVFTSVLRPLIQKAILPVVTRIGRAILWTGNLIGRGLSIVSQKAASLARLAFTYIINPLWRSVVRPTLLGIGRVISQGLSFVAQKAAQAVSWIFNKVVVPLVRNVLKPTATFVWKKVSWVATGAAKLICQLYGRVRVGIETAGTVLADRFARVATAARQSIRISFE